MFSSMWNEKIDVAGLDLADIWVYFRAVRGSPWALRGSRQFPSVTFTHCHQTVRSATRREEGTWSRLVPFVINGHRRYTGGVLPKRKASEKTGTKVV